MEAQAAILGSSAPTMRYERLLPLGVGGMATVHLALAIGQNGFNRLVVLKSVREGLPESPQMRQMFVNEARLTARLNHPNIVQAFEIIEDQDAMVLVMEYLDGLSLTDAYRAARHELSLSMRLQIVCEVLTGLHYAHEHTDFQGAPLGIVHRDVTPTNVFVTFDGRVKLLDFGIAKMTAAEDRTRTGMIKGKLAYMPAEQLAGRTIDRRTDIYAVGCLLWEAVAGSRIWEKRTEADIARNVLAGKIPALGSRVTVDPELERIVSTATASDPDARYATAAAMRDELEHFMSSLPPANAREVGEMLSAVCADARAEKQKKIARAVRQVEAQLAREREGTSAPPTETTVSPELSEVSAPSSLSRARTLAAPKRRGTWALALASVIVLATAVAWSQWPRESDASRSAAPSTSASAVAPALPKLTVQATPSTARVFVDGVRVSGNPAVVEVQPKALRSVRVELEGYEPTERSVRVAEDTLLTVDLVRSEVPPPSVAAEPARAPTTPRAGVPRASKPIAGKPPVPNRGAPSGEDACNPPYYFSGGIKTYKPECI